MAYAGQAALPPVPTGQKHVRHYVSDMAKLHIINLRAERRVEVVLSRRNLLTLLHKLDMPGSARMITNNDCWEDGEQTPYYPGEEQASHLARTTLVLRCEDDAEHYAKRPVGPGLMHPATEQFVHDHGGAPGELPGLDSNLVDKQETSVDDQEDQ